MIGTSLIGGLDTGLRGAAIALFLLIAVAVLRRGGGRPVAWLGAALSVGHGRLCSLFVARPPAFALVQGP